MTKIILQWKTNDIFYITRSQGNQIINSRLFGFAVFISGIKDSDGCDIIRLDLGFVCLSLYSQRRIGGL